MGFRRTRCLGFIPVHFAHIPPRHLGSILCLHRPTLLCVQVHSNPHIKHAIDIEQYLMEGAYNKVRTSAQALLPRSLSASSRALSIYHTTTVRYPLLVPLALPCGLLLSMTVGKMCRPVRLHARSWTPGRGHRTPSTALSWTI